MAKKLFVRFSEPEDEDAIFEFYASNPHTYVAKREPEVWRERIASGAVTLIHDEDGTIVASSISYPLVCKDEDGEDAHMWTEIGSTRVALDGIGLFKTLVSAQIMRAYLLEPPEDRFALEIIKGNEHSKHVFLKAGATAFDIPDALQVKVLNSLAPESKNIDVEWFQMGVETLPLMAQYVLDSYKNPKLVNKKTGEEYELDFSRCALTTQFLDAVENVAGLDFGDAKKPDMSHGLRSFRDKFNP